MTKGTFCSRMAGPACDRAIACGLGPASDRQGCLDEFQSGCCASDNTCGQRAQSAADQTELEQVITSCSAAWPTWDCAQYAQGIPPMACGGTTAAPDPSPAAPSATPARGTAASVHALGAQAGLGFGGTP